MCNFGFTTAPLTKRRKMKCQKCLNIVDIGPPRCSQCGRKKKLIKKMKCQKCLKRARDDIVDIGPTESRRKSLAEEILRFVML